MYIESEFALLEAQNEHLTRENKRLVAALEATTYLLEYVEEWATTTFNYTPAQRLKPSYYKNYDGVVNNARQALAPYQEECSCLPDLPDGRVNGGRGGCCPACEAEYDPDAPIPFGGE